MRQKLVHSFKAGMARDASILFAPQMLGLVLGFVGSILLARLLGPDVRGAYGWIMTATFFCLQFSMLGTDIINRRFGASHPQKRNALAGNTLLVCAICGLIAASVGYGTSQFFEIARVYPNASILAFCVVPFIAASGSLLCLFLPAGKIIISPLMDMSGRIAMLAGTLALLIIGAGYLWSILALYLAVSIGIFLATLWLLKSIAPKPWPEISFLKTSFPLMLGGFGGNLALIALQKIDVLMLGTLRSAAETGHYIVAVTLMDAAMLLPGVISVLLLNRLSTAGVDKAAHSHTRKRVSVATFVIMIGITAIGYFIGTPLIPVLFGEEFRASTAPFGVLMLATLTYTLFSLSQFALTARAHGWQIVLAPLAGFMCKFILCWWWIPPFGALGAAWATVFAFLVAFVVAFAIDTSHDRK